MTSARWGLAAVVFFAALNLASAPARAAVRTFTKIADTGTAIPGGTGNFTSLTNPQVSLGDVVFGGNGSGGQRGIYRFNPLALPPTPYSVIVDGNTVLPPGGTPSPQLSPTVNDGYFAVYGPDVSFTANYTAQDVRLLTTRGGLRILADHNSTPLGDSPLPPLSMDQQLYLASIMTQRPGSPLGTLVTSFVRVDDAGGHSGYPASENVEKYLARDGHSVVATYGRIAGTRGARLLDASPRSYSFSDGASVAGIQPPNFLLPGESSGFTISGGPILFNDDGRSVVFRASASTDGATATRTAILTQTVGQALRVVAETNADTPTPTGPIRFNSFSNVAIDGSLIALIGTPTAGPGGLFVESQGTLTDIVRNGDTVDGKTVTSIAFSGDRPLSGSDLAFTLTFSDTSNGLYLAAVPEPSAVGLLALAFVPLARASRSGRLRR
jgi:hypothetical protein